MGATSLVSFSSLSPPLPCPKTINVHRDVSSMPFNNSHLKWKVAADIRVVGPQRCLLNSTKAGLRGNLDTVCVPASVPVRVAHELLLAGHRYLDVRTPEEFCAGHAEGAINVPYMYRVGSGMSKNLKFVEEVSAIFAKYDEIIVGCQSGKRSLMAASDLLAAGFTNVIDIAGGFAAWKEIGLPSEA